LIRYDPCRVNWTSARSDDQSDASCESHPVSAIWRARGVERLWCSPGHEHHMLSPGGVHSDLSRAAGASRSAKERPATSGMSKGRDEYRKGLFVLVSLHRVALSRALPSPRSSLRPAEPTDLRLEAIAALVDPVEREAESVGDGLDGLALQAGQQDHPVALSDLFRGGSLASRPAEAHPDDGVDVGRTDPVLPAKRLRALPGEPGLHDRLVSPGDPLPKAASPSRAGEPRHETEQDVRSADSIVLRDESGVPAREHILDDRLVAVGDRGPRQVLGMDVPLDDLGHPLPRQSVFRADGLVRLPSPECGDHGPGALVRLRLPGRASSPRLLGAIRHQR